MPAPLLVAVPLLAAVASHRRAQTDGPTTGAGVICEAADTLHALLSERLPDVPADDPYLPQLCAVQEALSGSCG